MKPEQRARFIERAALREAQKAIKRRGGEPLTRGEVLGLRVQIASILVRVILGLLGLGCVTLAIVLMGSDVWLPPLLVLLVVGFILFFLGLRGWKKTVEACLKSMDSGLAEGVLRAIFESFT